MKKIVGGQYRPLSEDQVGRIHENALKILADVGIKVELPEALDIFSNAGARVDRENKTVRLHPKLVEQEARKAPSRVVLYGRKRKNDLVLEDCNVHMGTGGAALRVIDPDNQNIRAGRLVDISRLARLVEGLDNIHFFIRPCTARDISSDNLGVNEFYASLANTTKHVMGTGYTTQGVKDVIEMASMISGSHEKLSKKPFISFNVGWMKSPLTFEENSTSTLIEILKHKIPVALSSTPMAGSTSPITMAGTLTQLHAEELAGIVFCQLVQPGASVLYGGIPGMADMHDLSFKAGGVEFGLMNAGISQLANYLKIPNYCSAGITEAKIPSTQAIYEKTFSICQCALAGSNYIHHAAGVLESALTVDYGQCVIDNEIIGMAIKMIEGIYVDEDTIAYEEIKNVGPGGNFLSSLHTYRYLRTEFMEPVLIPRNHRASVQSIQDYQNLDVLYQARHKANQLIKTRKKNTLITAEIDDRIRQRFDIDHSMDF